jgi:serine/threonine-protein kinase RsbW
MATNGETRDETRLRLELTSHPESLTIVRSVLTALSDVIGLEGESADDVRTAVSEACNNVVLHAYGDGTGLLALSLASDGSTLEIDVEDDGPGITHVAISDERMGIGLALIGALADRMELCSAAGGSGGTCVKMVFGINSQRSVDRGSNGGVAASSQTPGPTWGESVTSLEASHSEPRLQLANEAANVTMRGDIVLWLSPVSILRPVSERMLRAVAAVSGGFTWPGASETAAVSDAVAAYADSAARDLQVGFTIKIGLRRLSVTVGPLLDEAARSAAASSEQIALAWSALRSVADSAVREPAAGYELLHVEIFDRHRAA